MNRAVGAVPRPPVLRRRLDLLIGLVGWAVAAAVLRLLSGWHAGPFITDEAGYLGNARVFAADGGRWLMDTSPYYRWGYSLLLVPIEALVDDPGRQFQWIVLLNFLLVGAMFPLLYALLRRSLRVSRWVAAVSAGVATIYPGVAVSAGMAMAENLLLPLYVLSLLALWSFLERRGPLGWTYGLLVLWLWACHRRVVPLLPLALLALLVGALTDRRRVKAAVVNAAVLLVGLYPVVLVDHRLVHDRWLRIRRPEEFSGGPSTLLTEPGKWGTYVTRLGGQVWYLSAGTLGLAVLGCIALLVARTRGRTSAQPETGALKDPGDPPSRREPVAAAASSDVAALGGRDAPPSRQERITSWLRAALADPVTVIGWFQVAVLGGMAALTAVFFTLVTTRMDQRVYGRYAEMVLPPVIAAGAAWLLTRPWRTVSKGAVAGLLVVGGATLAILGPQGMANFRGSGYSINQVVAIAWHGGDAEVPIPRATAYAVGALMLLVVAARLKLVLVWLAVASLLFAGAVRPVERRITGGQAFLNQRVDFPMDVRRAGDIESFAFAIDQASRQDAAVLQHWLPGKTMVPWWDGQPPPAGEQWAVARIGSRRVTLAGGRMVFINSRLHHAMYVLPGPEFDRLEAAGRLLPVRLREPLPDDARVGTISRRGGSGPVAVRSGETVDLPVRVAHRGTSAPWVDFGSYQGTGVVRVGYRWLDPATGEPEDEPKLLRADLTKTLWPGGTDDVLVPIEAIDSTAAPRAPGTYEIEVYLLQEQLGVFPGAPLRVTVEVR